MHASATNRQVDTSIFEDEAVKKVAAEYPAEPGLRVERKITVRIVRQPLLNSTCNQTGASVAVSTRTTRW